MLIAIASLMQRILVQSGDDGLHSTLGSEKWSKKHKNSTSAYLNLRLIPKLEQSRIDRNNR